MTTLSSGEIANLFQIPKSKLRYYIDTGLLTPKINEENGYYLFDEADIYRLYQITIFRKIGISINEIKDSQQMDNAIPLLEKSKNKLQQKINELIELQHLTDKIIESYNNSKLDEIFFTTYDTRYYKKFPSTIIKQTSIDFVQVAKKKISRIEAPCYVFSTTDKETLCFESEKKDYDYLFPKGNYICENFSAENETILTEKINHFLNDPFFQLHDISLTTILVYENIFCSLAYTDDVIYTIEVNV